MKRFLGVRALVAATLLAAACFTVSASGAGAAAASGTRVVAPKPLVPRGAKQLGAISPSATVTGAVVLRPRDEGALTRFIARVADKGSPLFHHYLAPGAFAARFGPAPDAVAAVETQLREDGLRVTSIARDRLILDFSAPASRVESAFRTGLERYRLRDGSIGTARTAPLRMPTTIARYVTSVVGLDNTLRFRSSSLVRASKSARANFRAAKSARFIHPAGSPAPCTDAQTAAQAFDGLTDDQIANAYGAFGLYGAGDFGSGQHIAVYELEPFAKSDIQTFDTCYFGATAASAMLSRLQTVPVDGGQTAGPGGGEAALDVQDVSAMAPGANIDVYEAPNNPFGAIDDYSKLVNDDVDQVVTTSWGVCEQAIQRGAPGQQQAENVLFQQAAAQGQSVFAASGDTGSDGCNAFREPSPTSPVLSVGDPASQPYVVAVGGTTIDDATQRPAEHVWNDGAFFGAGGGGVSESWAMPSWQLDSRVPGVNDATTVSDANAFEAADMGNPSFAFCASDSNGGASEAGCREVPDVSAQADEFTGAVTIYLHDFGGWFTIGGTSSAAPIWAALLADTNASPTCQSNNTTKSGVGFVDPLLYSVASNPASYAASFNDITTGNNDPYGDSNLFPATTGYDMASGLGSPELTQQGGGAGLAFYLCSAGAAATRPAVTGLSTQVAPTSASTTSVTITGTNFEKSGTPDVAGVQVGAYQVPSSGIHVTSPTTLTAAFPAASDAIPSSDPTDGAGRVQVTVTLKDGETSAPNANSGFVYVDENGSSRQIPAVTAIRSYGGPEAGGNVVDVYGSGFTGATGVAFGGVPATSYTVLHDWQIQATVPAFVSGTTHCDQDGSSFGTGENATNDVCQAQVVVSNSHGQSATSTILPLYEGAFLLGLEGVIPPPAGVEDAPAPTEYDYVPGPTITAISTDDGPASLASEFGDSVITIKGKGLNLATLDWVNFGDPTQELSQNYYNIVSVTGTEIQILAPPLPLEQPTVNPTTLPVTVQTIAGLSNSRNATYAGMPTVSSVVATSGPTNGQAAGPATGGTPIDIKGTGFAKQVFAVAFEDASFSGATFGTQYNTTANSNTDLTTTTVPVIAGTADTLVCTETACSNPSSFDGDPSDVFSFYPPGDPKIVSISPSSGPVIGGNTVTITGKNLGCVTGVEFGGFPADEFSNAFPATDCGSTTSVAASVPAAAKKGTVTVTLTTLESDFTGAPAATAAYTYTAPPRQTLTVTKSGAGRGKVTSRPAGINCGRTCSHGYTYGVSVTLKAKPAPGSRFAGWSGGCSGYGTANCIVQLQQNITARAKFVLKSCTVPGVKGDTVSAAKRAIVMHGCAVGKIGHASSGSVKAGRVISQSPKAGTHGKHGTEVNIVVSRGKH
jgi:hypothetical protein